MDVSYIVDVSGDFLPYLSSGLNVYPGILTIIIVHVPAVKVSGV
jgi:hypothetical protein